MKTYIVKEKANNLIIGKIELFPNEVKNIERSGFVVIEVN